VSALRPAQALTVKENILIIEAAQLMAAKRSDCVLVVDEEDHLSGIFTVGFTNPSAYTLWKIFSPLTVFPSPIIGERFGLSNCCKFFGC
jgi:CBS domain